MTKHLRSGINRGPALAALFSTLLSETTLLTDTVATTGRRGHPLQHLVAACFASGFLGGIARGLLRPRALGELHTVPGGSAAALPFSAAVRGALRGGSGWSVPGVAELATTAILGGGPLARIVRRAEHSPE